MKPGKAFPYLAFLTEPGEPWDTLKNSSYLRSGPYAEYYPNGRVKVEGQYKEEFVETDSLITLDSLTYEQIKTPVKGSFWTPRNKMQNQPGKGSALVFILCCF